MKRLARLAKDHSAIVVVTDKNVGKLWLRPLLLVLPQAKVVIVPAGEKSKDIKHLQLIWKEMLDANCDRKSLVVALGGGAITDLAGFAAATYMRGVDVAYVPTTLLAQVDAAVGGKTGIDFGGGKNVIGAFHQPVAVINDARILSTLPKRQLRSGWAEVIKHGLIADRDYFAVVTAKKPEEYGGDELKKIISRSVEIKMAIVEKDEKEAGLRKLLNFGHTVGHALEAVSWTPPPKAGAFRRAGLLHGEAVAWGMLVAARISQRLGLLPESELKMVNLVLRPLPKMSVAEVMKKITTDKKMDHGVVQWTLLAKIGKAVINQVVGDTIVK